MKPKSQSERDGEDLVQVSGSPHVSQPGDLLERPLRPFDIRCPQCGGPCDVRQWGTVCLRAECRTVLDDQHSGRFSGKPNVTIYKCANCGGETSDRYYRGTGDGPSYIALCADCEEQRTMMQTNGRAA